MSANPSRYRRDPNELTHTVEEWDASGNLARYIGKTLLPEAAHGMFELAVEKWPDALITLGHAARVIRDSARPTVRSVK